MNTERGIALVLVILLGSFLGAVAMGLALVVFIDQLSTANLHASAALLYAADAGIELAAYEADRESDWTPLLAGLRPSSMTDGPGSGVRALPGGGTIDLTAATNLLNCGRTSACTVAQMNATTRDRPWGANSTRWRPYVHGPVDRLLPLERPVAGYLIVWIGDDGRELDGDPLADAGPADPGAGILRVRAEAHGIRGLRRVIEAEVARRCAPSPADGNGCQQRIHVQSWQEVRQTVP